MLLDTSALVEILLRKPGDPVFDAIEAALGDEALFASPIHLGELADAARRQDLPVDQVVQAARTIVDLVPLDADLAIQASALKAEARRRKAGRGFSLIDGIGLASARSRGLRLLTFDAEFEGFPDATVLRRGRG
jgi:predicted nucleic acid-binding protein